MTLAYIELNACLEFCQYLRWSSFPKQFKNRAHYILDAWQEFKYASVCLDLKLSDSSCLNSKCLYKLVDLKKNRNVQPFIYKLNFILRRARVALVLLVSHSSYNRVALVPLVLKSCRTIVALALLVFYSYHTGVALMRHLRHQNLTHVELMSRMSHQCRTCVALVTLVFLVCISERMKIFI